MTTIYFFEDVCAVLIQTQAACMILIFKMCVLNLVNVYIFHILKDISAKTMFSIFFPLFFGGNPILDLC